MFFIAYAFKGRVHVFAGRVKVVSHSSCRTSAIFEYFCPLMYLTNLYLSMESLSNDGGSFVQGPFREPEEVQKQRYKAFQPTLRVATSFTSLEDARERMKAEEWLTRLNDDM